MLSLRTEAESIAIALGIGLFDVADAVQWADQVIERSDVPDGAICDVALAASKFPQDVARILRSLPGDCDRPQAVRLVLRYAIEAMEQAKRDPRDVARGLFDLAYRGDLPESELKYHAWGYWDAIDFARDGYVDQTEEQIASHMISTIKIFLANQDDDSPG
jgi:hypothetical protein